MKDRLVKVRFASVCFWHFLLWCKSQLKWLSRLCLVLHAYGCAQVLDPKFQSDSFSKDRIITKIELKRSLQVNDSPDFLPIDVKGSPDTNKRIVLVVPEQDSKAGTKSTAIDALKPILTGSYSYAVGKVDEVNKFFGQDIIDFSMTNPIKLKVFSEANTQETYTIFIKTKVFSEAPPEAFNIKITTEVNRQIMDILPNQQVKTYQTFTGAYAYADVNFDQEASTTFEWQRGDSSMGTFKKIKGINLQDYSTRSQDGGKYLKFVVTPVADSGIKNGKSYFSLPIGPIKPLTGLALAQSRIKIVEIGRAIDNNDKNDYIILHNQENFPVSTRGLYIGRDSGCTLTNGWTSYDVLPDFLIPAQGYYLISESMNTIGADHSSWGGLSLNDCIALVASSVQPTHAISSYVIDFVAFGTAKVKGEGGTNAPALMKRKILRRKNSCLNNIQDTDNNAADFELFDPSGFIKQVRSSRVKNCAVKLPPNPLKIAEIGNKYASETNNDYIILHNPSNQPISLNGLYIGQDSNCTISSGFATYRALLNGGVVAANGYYLVARTGNNIQADSTILGSITTNYCVVLANSSKSPTSPTNDQVIDFVAFGTTTIKGEGGINAAALNDGQILRREMCERNNQANDSDQNINDFDLLTTIPAHYVIRNSMRDRCTSMITMSDGGNSGNCPMLMSGSSTPVSGSTTLVIAEVGNNINNITANDYIVLYNKSNASIDLCNYYIGRDSGCNFSNPWTKYKALSGTIVAHGYFLISRRPNSLLWPADFTWSGALSTNYCVVLANSSTEPNSATDSNVIDFVSFKENIGEGGNRAGILSNKKYLRRNGTCLETDTNNNANDFTRSAITSSYKPRNSGTAACP